MADPIDRRLVGVRPDSDYPAREIAFDAWDCFVLHTDGADGGRDRDGRGFGHFRLNEAL